MTVLHNTMTTAEALVSQFVENTGSDLLDSGGAYGRNWERNEGKGVEAWMDAPSATIHDNGTPYAYVTINTFRWLESRLDYDADMQSRFDEFAEGSTAPWLVDMEAFAEEIHDDQVEQSITVNTCNYESLLDEVLQYTTVICDGERYVLLQYHGGCDVRGGYTAPKVYRMHEYALFDEAVEFYCTEDPEHSLTLSGTEWVDYGGVFLDNPWGEGDMQLGSCPTCGAKQEVEARLDY